MFILTLLCIFICNIVVMWVEADQPTQVSLLIRNLSGKNINVNWMSPDGRLVPQTSTFIRNATKYQISSFFDHSFVVVVGEESGRAHELVTDLNVIRMGHEDVHCEVHYTNKSMKNSKDSLRDTKDTVGDNGDDDNDADASALAPMAGVEPRIVLDCSTPTSTLVKSVAKSIGHCRDENGVAIGVDGDTETGGELSLESCMLEALEGYMAKEARRKDILRQYRDAMSNKLAEYMCRDVDRNITSKRDPEIDPKQKLTLPSFQPSDPQRPRLLNVHVDEVYESPGASVWVVDGLLSDGECNHLVEFAEGDLVASQEYNSESEGVDYGSGSVTNSRVASARSMFFYPEDFRDDFRDNDDDNALPTASPAQDGGANGRGDGFVSNVAVYKRVHYLVNRLTGYNMNIEGQEGLQVIRYLQGDHYKPHCDGPCGNDQNPTVKPGMRVATAIMYCRAPEQGGDFILPNLAMRIPIKPGRAVVMRYGGDPWPRSSFFEGVPDPNGATVHAGCPVTKGEKWIATAWFRQGVSANRDWTRFDSYGEPLDGIDSESMV